MANREKLPWDLVDEILSLVPPTSLDRFKTVCKRWNALFKDKAFINNHKMTFQFILTTRSKIYSVSVNPNIVVRELTLGLKSQIPRDLVDCNEFLLCGMSEGAVVWNPWLRQTRCIEPEVNEPHNLTFVGIGYDNNKRVEEIVYKILYCYMKEDFYTLEWKIYAWKDQKLEKGKYTTWPIRTTSHGERFTLLSLRGVSLNGTLYWVASYSDKTYPFFVLMNFNFSDEEFSKFCDLPCGKNHDQDALVLRVFKGDRFSLLKQCHVTKKIMIWVTKKKIDNWHGGVVKWKKFMEVSHPNLPNLVSFNSHYQPSYFIDDKKLVMCSCDDIGRAWIHVMGGNKFISKQLDSVVEPWPLHCTYFPSLVLVPGGQREEAEVQVKFSYFWLLVWLFRKLKWCFAFFGKINYS